MFIVDKTKHEYRFDGKRVPSVTDCITGLGWLNVEHYPASASIRGSRVHRCCELLETSGLDWDSIKPIEAALGEPIKGYVRAYEKFLGHEHWESSEIEQPLISKAYGFAGTPDRIHKNRRKGLDLKTGIWSDSWKYQMAGYSILSDIDFWDIVQLRPDGDYKITTIDAAPLRQIFLCMMVTFKEGVRYGKYEYED